MGLLETYPWLYAALLHLHRTAVTASLLVFTIRGFGVLLHHAWPRRRTWRRASVVIDTTLLLAGAGLWHLVSHNPLREPWLSAKLALLLVYIGLGILALGRAPTQRQRLVCFMLALACALTMVSIALTRSPWGWLSPWLG